MKISKYWSLSRGLGVLNFSAQFPPFIYYYYVYILYIISTSRDREYQCSYTVPNSECPSAVSPIIVYSYALFS